MRSISSQVVPADVADPDLVRARPEGEAERVAQPVGDDPPGVRDRCSTQRVVRGSPAPVAGVDAQERAVQEHGLAGRPAELCARSAPPSAVGGVCFTPVAGRRVAARVRGVGVPVLPPTARSRCCRSWRRRRRSRRGRRRRRSAGRRSSGSGTAGTMPSIRAVRCRRSTSPGALQPDEPPADDTAVRGRAGRRRADVVPARGAVCRRCARVVACTGRRRTATPGSPGRAQARAVRGPRSRRSPARRSANIVGVVSERLSKTLISPPFSATKTLPSGAKRKFVGFVRPEKTIVSEKPAGRLEGVAAAVVCGFPRKGFADCAGGGGFAADAIVTRRKVTAAAADNFAIRLFTDARMGEDEADSLPARRQTAAEKLAERVGRRLCADQDATAARRRRSE